MSYEDPCGLAWQEFVAKGFEKLLQIVGPKLVKHLGKGIGGALFAAALADGFGRKLYPDRHDRQAVDAIWGLRDKVSEASDK